MVDIGIKITQDGYEGGPGESRSDLVLGEEVTLSNFGNDAGVHTWRWEIINKPRTSSIVLTNPVPEIARFTPDVVGSYLIQLTINGRVKQRVVAAILTPRLGIRIPAIGEAEEFSGGWAQAFVDALLTIEERMPDAPIVVTVDVTAAEESTYVGHSVQFYANANYSDGSSIEVTDVASWSSDNEGNITVDSSGVTLGISSGSANITASFSGVEGVKNITCS